MSRKIFIFDTTLRDGEQVPGASLNAAEKMEIAKQLALLGVDIMEVGFPISSLEDFNGVYGIASQVKGPTICALARCIEEDIDRAGEALKPAEKALLHVFIGTSEIHLKGQLRKTEEEVLRMIDSSVRQAKQWCSEVEFSPMDASRTDLGYLREAITTAIEAGATVINIPDTVGYAVPEQFGWLIRWLLENVLGIDRVRLSVHCHNDLDMATSNSLAAVKAGATQVECTVGGIGERAGNAPLEAVVMALKARADCFNVYTDIKAKLITNTFLLVAQLMGLPIPPNKAIVGTNAFAHSSGVHQDGVLKNRLTYEIIDPVEVGAGESAIILTARSGRHALSHRLSELGYELSKKQLTEVYYQFLRLADKKKQVGGADLRALVGMVLRGLSGLAVFDVSVVFNKTNETYQATVKVKKEDDILEWHGAAKDGPFDAIFHAIQEGTGTSFELVEYGGRGVTEGSDAANMTVVRLRHNGRTSRGIGLDTDSQKAAADAYLDAVIRAQNRQTEDDFNPQWLGKPKELIAAEKYSVPESPLYGFLLVAVKGREIVFAHVDDWKGGWRKSGSGWVYWNVREEVKYVGFPQFRQDISGGGRYIHGAPEFIPKTEKD